MEASESSKVTGMLSIYPFPHWAHPMPRNTKSFLPVEYHDPAGVFPLISHQLAHRLPLRNLNWHSPSRPLRQIKSLHVDFVPDKHTSSSLRPPAQRVDSTGPNSVEIVRSGHDSQRQVVTERRHQIPGLKTSPYLKVYLLRCDDKDAYKTIERQKLRQWLRDNAPTEGKREKHDAFEWLVIHVVIPDTVVSSEPRWREGGSKDEDELRERPKSSAKWPGKSTRTVFDKLRADFNESSKSGSDRIAQLRLTKDQVPPDLLPTPAVAPTLEETLPERENAWADLVSKLKNLILIPFDLRVRQYEEDIAEQDSRRALPGWNFCTFFIHKEGLAKALESVGMVEDALALYDELSIGLESVLRDQAAGKEDGSATTFEPCTADIEGRILGVGTQRSGSATKGDVSSPDRGSAEHNFSLFSKDYRERIVMSQISVFDFFCYLFVRQKALLLRLANAQVVRQELGGPLNEDLMLMAEVNKRALSFIHANGRILRADLKHGYASSVTSPRARPSVDSICRAATNSSRATSASIASLVSSWCHAVAGLVLDETTTSAPTLAEANRASTLAKLNGNAGRPDFGFGMGANPYPQRFNSLNNKRAPSTAPELRSPPPGPDGMFSPPSSSGGESDRAFGKSTLPGMVELAVHRAELTMLRRKMLELLGERRGWFAGWAGQRRKRLQATPGNDGPSLEAEDFALNVPNDNLSPALAYSLESEFSFQETYAKLSDSAIRHYQLAGHFKSAEAVRGDLAVLKMQRKDYAGAAAFFQQALPAYAVDGWSLVEAEALSMHAGCLRELRERNDYVRTVLALLKRIAKDRMEQPRVEVPSDSRSRSDFLDGKGYLTALLDYSDVLPYDITSPLGDYFADLVVDCTVQHLKDKDGFKLSVSFRHVLDDDVDLDQASMRLVRVDDTKDELWLHSEGPIRLTIGVAHLELESATSTLGAFLVDTVIIKSRRLRFEHQLQPPELPDATALGISYDETSISPHNRARPFVLLYPAAEAFDAEISLASTIHIDKPRHLHITLRSGRNDVSSLGMKLKPTSAGLRLHLGDTMLLNIEEASTQERQGQVNLGPLSPRSEAVVTLPYTIETSGQPISLRLEATYQTPSGAFTFTVAKRLTTELALDVDVNDIFHHDALFSNFMIRTMHSMPLCITHIELQDSAVYAAKTTPFPTMPLVVFESQPATLVYKIIRKSTKDDEVAKSKKESALSLIVEHFAADDLVEYAAVQCLDNCLRDSDFAGLARLLTPVLRERCKHSLSSTEAEVAMLVKEVRVPSFDEIGWDEILGTLPAETAEGTAHWLRKWHRDNERLEVGGAEHSIRASKQITLTVDVPNVDFVNTAALRLYDTEDEQQAGSVIFTLGEPLHVRVSVTSTRAWGVNASKAMKTQQSFTLEVQPEPDTWLVGGSRRSRFTMNTDDEPYAIPFMLIPLKVGDLALPNLELLPVTNESGSTETEAPSCETNFENAGHIVTVVKDVRTSRMWVPDAASSTTGGRGSAERRGSSRSRGGHAW